MIWLIDGCKGSYKFAKRKEAALGKPVKQGNRIIF